MPFDSGNAWAWFCMLFAGMLLASYIMGRQGRHFYTFDVVRRRFSILDLEFAATPVELANTLRGVFLLPPPESRTAVRSIRAQLITDTILFMPCTYTGIFLLCMKTAERLSPFGAGVFIFLAWAQIIAFLLDLIENIYLWRKLHAGVQPSSPGVHRAYQWLEGFKWGLSCTGAIGSFSALACLWLSGFYSDSSLPYITVFFVEIAVFLAATVLTREKKEVAPAS